VADSESSLEFPDLPKLELDQLLDQLVVRAQDVMRTQGRLRALLRAIETVTEDLALEVVLRNVVEAACELAHAEYGALGVISPDGGLEQFIHVGIDDATADRIGHLPEGKGLLGALITDPRPIRLRHMSSDARSVGFPPNHPPMDSFLGVPIHVRGEVYGNLYLANSDSGEFGPEDEVLVGALARAAGTAISNARLFRESEMQYRWLEASLEVGNQLLTSAGEDPLHLVARRVLEMADSDLVCIGLTTADGENFVVEEAFGHGCDELTGHRFPLADSLTKSVLDQARPLLTANASDPSLPPSYLSAVLEVGPLMVVPFRGGVEHHGVLSIARARGRRAFTQKELTMAAGFATHASVALELADSRASEQRLMLLEDRDRIAMDLHDHVIQELFAIGLSLEGGAAQLGPSHPVGQRIQLRIADLDRAIRRIRTSIFELRGTLATPPEGLRQRVLEVTSEVTPALGFAPHVAFGGLLDLPLPEKLSDDVLACVRESLTNVAKHAQAKSAMVDLSLAGDTLTVTISDDGVGVGEPTRRSGTANLLARAESWSGTYDLTAGPAGRGTTAVWTARVPG
jgi:signal transduction histidine kinase